MWIENFLMVLFGQFRFCWPCWATMWQNSGNFWDARSENRYSSDEICRNLLISTHFHAQIWWSTSYCTDDCLWAWLETIKNLFGRFNPEKKACFSFALNLFHCLLCGLVSSPIDVNLRIWCRMLDYMSWNK